MKKRVLTLIISALTLMSLITLIPVNADNEVVYGSVKVLIIDEETNEPFAEDSKCFEAINYGVTLGEWNPAESNPYTITGVDLKYPNVKPKFKCCIVYYGKELYDDYMYCIDEEKCNRYIEFTDEPNQEVTIYMKKHYFKDNTPAVEEPEEEITMDNELKSFEELYSLDEKQLKQYCKIHDLRYISKNSAINDTKNDCAIFIRIKPDNYLLPDDIYESEIPDELIDIYYEGYDFGKMIAELKFPDKYYKFYPNGFDYCGEFFTDENGELKEKILKLASIQIVPNRSVNDDDSIIRLYQLASIWAEQNPIVYQVSFQRPGGGMSGTSEDKALKGDANLDGRVDLADLTTVAKYNLNNEAYPLANDTAYTNADMNGDGVVDGLDTSALIENQPGKK